MAKKVSERKRKGPNRKKPTKIHWWETLQEYKRKKKEKGFTYRISHPEHTKKNTKGNTTNESHDQS